MWKKKISFLGPKWGYGQRDKELVLEIFQTFQKVVVDVTRMLWVIMLWNYFLPRLLLFAGGPNCHGDVDLEEVAFHGLIIGQCLLLLFSDVLLTTLDTCLMLFWSPGWRSVEPLMLLSLWCEPWRLRTLRKYFIIFKNKTLIWMQDMHGVLQGPWIVIFLYIYIFNACCCCPVLTA